MTRERLRPAALLAGAVAALLAGCSSLPDSGSVQVQEPTPGPRSAAPFDFDPPGPQPGSSREQVVAGFLRALQATPGGARSAAEFLTADAAESWRPDRRTLVYDGTRVRSSPAAVTLLLDGAFALDAHGRWRGRVGTSEAPHAVPLRLVREDGEWRIADPPDATVVPRSHFATRYRAYALYFFDPTGSVLVPEPVYLPWGPQTPTALVDGLLAGPARQERALVRSFFPRATRLEVSVPVSDAGVAEVPLSTELRDLDEPSLQRVLAQLAWTLRQVTEVRSMRPLVEGVPLELPGDRDAVSVAGWTEHDPAVASASTDLFGTRGGLVRQVVGGEEIAASSYRGAGLGRPRALGVSLTGQRFALVAEDGGRVAVLTRLPDSRVVEVRTGRDLLRPLWDRTDRLWLLDRTAAGLAVRVVGPRADRTLAVPGLEGRGVRAAALSRDGSRLALLVGGAGGRSVLLARVERDAGGAPLRLTRAVAVADGPGLATAVDLGWRDPLTLAVLTRPTSATSQVVLASVDGASALLRLDATPDVLYDEGRRLAASPGGPLALLVAAEAGRLHSLDQTGRWDLDAVAARVRLPTFAG